MYPLTHVAATTLAVGKLLQASREAVGLRERAKPLSLLERAKGFEPSTLTLAT
jgi:hypothetical protein